MKTKPSKQPKQAKTTVKLKDIKPKEDAKGGGLHKALCTGQNLATIATAPDDTLRHM